MIESLIQSSALDSFGLGRAPMVTAVEPYLNLVSQSRKQKMEGQLTMFDMGINEEAPAEPVLQEVKDYSRLQKLEYEQELLGMYVTGHPLDAFTLQLNNSGHMQSDELNPPPTVSDEVDEDTSYAEAAYSGRERDNGPVSMAGMVVVRRNQTTRKGELMSFLTMEDISGRFEVIVFPRVLRDFGELIREGRVLIVRGRISVRETDENQLIADNFELLEEDRENLQTTPTSPSSETSEYPQHSKVELNLDEDDPVMEYAADDRESHLAYIRVSSDQLACAEERLKAARGIHPGKHSLVLISFIEDRPTIHELSGFSLHHSFMLYLVQQFGLENVWIVEAGRTENPSLDYNVDYRA